MSRIETHNSPFVQCL